MVDERVKQIEKKLEEITEILELPKTESNKDTPLRVAKMWCNEIFRNRNNNNIEQLNASMKLFPNNYDSGIVIVHDIPFSSTCEHHWLPFIGKVTVGYIPNESVVGLSKIPRVVKYFSKKPQLQEQLTTEIGEYLYQLLKPHAIFVEVQASHQCVSCRGAESECATYTIYKKMEAGFEESYQEYKELRNTK